MTYNLQRKIKFTITRYLKTYVLGRKFKIKNEKKEIKNAKDNMENIKGEK